MDWLLKFLMTKLTEMLPWFGVGVILGEMFLHAGNTSSLMFLLGSIMLFIPETKIRPLLSEWSTKLKAALEK